jgi:hypothetical protein
VKNDMRNDAKNMTGIVVKNDVKKLTKKFKNWAEPPAALLN